MLRDSISGKEIKLPKIHGNTKIRNFLTGKRDRTYAQWRREGKEAAERLLRAFGEE